MQIVNFKKNIVNFTVWELKETIKNKSIKTNQSTLMNIDEHSYNTFKINTNLWKSLNTNENLWNSIQQNPWKYMKIDEHTLSETNNICRAIERAKRATERVSKVNLNDIQRRAFKFNADLAPSVLV